MNVQLCHSEVNVNGRESAFSVRLKRTIDTEEEAVMDVFIEIRMDSWRT